MSTSTAKNDHLGSILNFLQKRRKEDVNLSDVFTLAEITVESLQAFLETMDSALYRELREIAAYIQTMKSEIGALQVHDIKNSHIPAAGEELSAIVKATEKATNTIMECAETLMEATVTDPQAYKALVEEKMVIIFEACSFQDITGQRIAKVVETLQQIEARVSRFANAVNVRESNSGFVTEEERARAARREALLLNGPQLENAGVDQNTVDNLMRNN